MKQIRPVVAALAGVALLAFTAGNAQAQDRSHDAAAGRARRVVERAVGKRVHQVRSSAPADMSGVSITAPSNRTYRTDRSMIAVIERGQRGEVRFGLPADVTAERALDGSVLLTRADGKVAMIAAPWAKDANGRSLPTRYVVEAGSLVQRVDTARAAYPIAADPYVSITWWGKKQIYFNRSETARLATGGGLGRLVLAALPGVNVAASAVFVWAGAAVAAGVCVQLIGTTAPNSPFIPAYHWGSRCR